MIPKLTLAGLELIADAISSGYPVQLTHIAFGTGEYDPDGSETALTNQSVKKAIAAGTNFANQVRIYAVWDNNVQAAAVTEVGIFAGTTLFAIWSNAEGDPVAYKSLEVDLVAYYDFIVDQIPAYAIEVVADDGESALLSALAEHTMSTDPHPTLSKRTQNIFCGTATGSNTNFTLTPFETIDQLYSAYTAGDKYTFKASQNNRGAVFISVNGLSSKELLLKGLSLTANTIKSGKYYEVLYHNLKFHIINSYDDSTEISINPIKNAVFNGDFYESSLSGNDVTISSANYNGSYFDGGAQIAKNWYAIVYNNGSPITSPVTFSVVKRTDSDNFDVKSRNLLKIESNQQLGNSFVNLINRNEEGSLFGRGIALKIADISEQTITFSIFAQTDVSVGLNAYIHGEYGDISTSTPSASTAYAQEIFSGTIDSAETLGKKYTFTYTFPDLITGKVFAFEGDGGVNGHNLERFCDVVYLRLQLNFSNSAVDTTLYLGDVQIEKGEYDTVFENADRLLHSKILNAMSGTLDSWHLASQIENITGDDNLRTFIKYLKNGVDDYGSYDRVLQKNAMCGWRTVRIVLDQDMVWELESVASPKLELRYINLEIDLAGHNLTLTTDSGYGYSTVFNNSNLRIYNSTGTGYLVIDSILGFNGEPFIKFKGMSNLVVEENVKFSAIGSGGCGELIVFSEDDDVSWIGSDNLGYELVQSSYSGRFSDDGGMDQSDPIILVSRFSYAYNGDGTNSGEDSGTPFWKYIPIVVTPNNKSSGLSGTLSAGASFNLCSLPFYPDIIQVWLQCTTAEYGYTVGQKIIISSISHGQGGVHSGVTYTLENSAGNYYLDFQIAADATQLIIALRRDAGHEGESVYLTHANWKIGAKLVHIPDAYID